MLLVWRLAVQVKPLGDRPQSELLSKIRELTTNDVNGLARQCVIELGMD